jgi:glycosyltransferase involved in cell wall biosynthesis
MKVVVVNFAYDERLRTPEDLLEHYQSLTGWCEALVAAGAFAVTVVQRFSADASLHRNGVEYRLCNGRLLPGSLLRRDPCHRFVADGQAEIVHVNGLDFPFETALLRRALRSDAALIVQDHASGEPGPVGSLAHAARRSLRRRLMQPIDGFFFTSAAQSDGWRRAGLIADRQPVYEVLEASTRMKRVDRTEARKEAPISGDPALLWVGRFNANKDPMTVLDGFEQSLARLPSSRLSMIFSEGELLGAVRSRIAASPALSARVELIGKVAPERMASFYSAADIFVVGSHHEGSGYALLEACACGLAPVVTDIPAFRTITSGGAIGALWPAGNSPALADAIVRTAGPDRHEMRNRVLGCFEQTLSWSAVGRAAMRAYQEVVARRRAKTA